MASFDAVDFVGLRVLPLVVSIDSELIRAVSALNRLVWPVANDSDGQLLGDAVR